MNYNYIDSQSYSQSNSATYNGNPFVGENNELMEEEQLAVITLNRRSSESSNRSHQQSLGLQSNYYTYFDGEADAHIEVRMNLNTNNRFQSSTELQQTDYLQYGDSVWHYLRESIAPNHSERIDLSASGGFSFGPKKFRQNITFSYEFSHNNSTSERVYYDLTNNHQRLDSISTYLYYCSIQIDISLSKRDRYSEHEYGHHYDAHHHRGQNRDGCLFEFCFHHIRSFQLLLSSL